MRYRKLDSNGDYTFGHRTVDFLVDSPACVAQAVLTALRLFQGEWFLDVTAGVPWTTQILGHNTKPLYDAAIKSAVQGVQGVTEIVSYSSFLDTRTRQLTVAMVLNTKFGATGTLTAVLTGGVN